MKPQIANTDAGRRQRSVGTVLMTLVGFMLLASAATKLGHVPSVVSQLAGVGIAGDRLIFVGILEAVSALLFLVPATRSAGLLLVSAFMGGAIATHLQHAQSIGGPAIVLTVAWLGVWLRHPEISWSWTRPSSRARLREVDGLGELQ